MYPVAPLVVLFEATNPSTAFSEPLDSPWRAAAPLRG
jgi:hypothetical protein